MMNVFGLGMTKVRLSSRRSRVFAHCLNSRSSDRIAIVYFRSIDAEQSIPLGNIGVACFGQLSANFSAPIDDVGVHLRLINDLDRSIDVILNGTVATIITRLR